MTPDEFLASAGPLLLADEARHNLLFGIAGNVRDAPHLYPEARFWVVDGAAALRTPPHNLVLARPRDERALQALVAAIDDDPPGVTAAVPEVHEFARVWGRETTVVMHQRIFQLDRVADVPAGAGAAREASRDDFDLLVDWWMAFAEEATASSERADIDRYRAVIEYLLSSHDRGVALWEHDGAVVSLCGYGAPTPHGIRIGPVYTPPELRGRGHATALVADVSRQLLASGRSFCFLYTDASNPTSNAIYERIGYRAVCESAQLAFQ